MIMSQWQCQVSLKFYASDVTYEKEYIISTSNYILYIIRGLPNLKHFIITRLV